MQNFVAKDNKIIETAMALNKTLQTIVSQLLQESATSQFAGLIHELSDQIATFEQQLNAFSEKTFSFEFYDEVTDLIEQITDLRLDKDWRQTAQPLQGNALLDRLVAAIHAAVYRHPELTDQSPQVTPTQDLIATAQATIEAATRHATELTTAAEKANNEGAKILEEMQQEQARSGGTVDPKLMERSINQATLMCARNAAAVLGTDAVAIAIVKMEELQAKNGQN